MIVSLSQFQLPVNDFKFGHSWGEITASRKVTRSSYISRKFSCCLSVISDPDTTFSQVISCTAVAKCTLSFHNLTSSRMVEVKQLRKKVLFIINLGRIKQNNKKQMLLKGGVATPSTPPLDPPLLCKRRTDCRYPASRAFLSGKFFSMYIVVRVSGISRVEHMTYNSGWNPGIGKTFFLRDSKSHVSRLSQNNAV